MGGGGKGNFGLNSWIGQVACYNFSLYWSILYIFALSMFSFRCFTKCLHRHKFAVLLCGSMKWCISQVAYTSLALSKNRIVSLTWVSPTYLGNQLASLQQNLSSEKRATKRPTKTSLAAIDLIPDETLVDPHQVPEGLRCIICTEVFVEPVGSGNSTFLDVRGDLMERQCKCGIWSCHVRLMDWTLRSCQHVFCLACITRALASKAECPLCREEMHVLRLRRCQPIQSLVDEVQVLPWS